MTKKKRSMSSEDASLKKIAGHINEYDFAKLIGGEVHKGTQTDKQDVIDQQHCFHSVKAGTWWQIFLYSQERWKDTGLQGIGNVANIMIDCLNAYPQNYEKYTENKQKYKDRLQYPMQKLLQELQNERIFKAFIEKALFDGSRVNYLSIYPGPAKHDLSKKIFHIFYRDDVIKAISRQIYPENSKARNRNQTDNQKVVLKSRLHNNTNVGEIEVRYDKSNYKKMKFRLNSGKMLDILKKEINLLKPETLTHQVICYGRAIKLLRISKSK